MMRRVFANQLNVISLATAAAAPSVNATSTRGVHGVRLTTSFMKPATADGSHSTYEYDERPSTGKELPNGRKPNSGNLELKSTDSKGDEKDAEILIKPEGPDILRSDQTPF